MWQIGALLPLAPKAMGDLNSDVAEANVLAEI